MFSGSYCESDVVFLLKPVRLEPTPIAEKERLIQTRQRHYSEMISRETLPSANYLRVFHDATARTITRLAQHILCLAAIIADARRGVVTLVSLARAGTPIGVLLARTLRIRFHRDVVHYSLSLIRDRGIDEVAVRHVLGSRPSESIVFVDGWTGKGVMADELHRAIVQFNNEHGTVIDPGLFVVTDLSGTAARSASMEDWLIPSAVLGATISGLVSRSILNRSLVGETDFHGCLYYREFEPHDQSRWFVNVVCDEIMQQPLRITTSQSNRPQCRIAVAERMTEMKNRHGIRVDDYLKPGIGEATRVLLRRVPHRLLLRDAGFEDVAHLVLLAEEKGVKIVTDPALPFQAVALIKELN
jgi:hypothetical protein